MDYDVQFPDPNQADDVGLIAVGGELSPEFLVSAYSQGIFPWFSEDDPIMWFSPDPRMVLYPTNFKLSKSLKQLINNERYSIRIDSDFEAVIRNCAKIPRPGQDGTWITGDMINAYITLHKIGISHSFETYNKNNELVGGLYGVSLGKAFFGESMFFKERDASKFALYKLVEWCKQNDFHFIDAQQSTQHLKSLGAIDLPRTVFLENLNMTLTYPTIKGKWSLFNT